MGIIDGLLPAIDSILSIREAVGAVISPVYLVTRTWYADSGFTTAATQIGEGFAQDILRQMRPAPGLKNYSQDIKLREGGAVKAGDIILVDVSKNSYAESDLDAKSPSLNVEKFYLVGDKLYQVINLVSKYVTWDVQIRELANQTRY